MKKTPLAWKVAFMRLRGNSGITLLELVLAVGISGLLLLGMGMIYAGAWGSWQRAANRMRLHRALNQGLAIVTREVREAKTIQASGPTLLLTFDDSTHEHQVRFEVGEGQIKRNARVIEVLADTGLQWLDFDSKPITESHTGLVSLLLTLKAASGSENAASLPETLQVQTEVLSRNGLVSPSGYKL
jgi:Tfp pilus assembly protein PilW